MSEVRKVESIEFPGFTLMQVSENGTFKIFYGSRVHVKTLSEWQIVELVKFLIDKVVLRYLDSMMQEAVIRNDEPQIKKLSEKIDLIKKLKEVL